MELNEYYCKQTIFDKQTWEIKIPQNADDYLNRQARFIDTSDIIEVIDLYHYKEPQSSANDYVCVCLRLKDAKLVELYEGCSYLFQVWKGKDRLFQLPHNNPIQALYPSKTNLAFILDENAMNPISRRRQVQTIVYVVRPFNKRLAKVLCPLNRKEGGKLSLFVCPERLLIGQGNTIKAILISQLFDQKSQVESAFKKLVGFYFDEANENKAITTINEEPEEDDDQSDAIMFEQTLANYTMNPRISNVRGGFKRNRLEPSGSEMFGDIAQITQQSEVVTMSQGNLQQKPSGDNQRGGASSISFTTLTLGEAAEVFCFIHETQHKNSMTVYSATRAERKAENLLIVTSHLIDFKEEDSASAKLTHYRDYCVDESHMGDPITALSFTSILNGIVQLITLTTEQGHWFLLGPDFQILTSSCILKDHFSVSNNRQLLLQDIKVGLEALYIKVQTGKILSLEFDQAKDTASLKLGHFLDYKDGNFAQYLLTEKFIRLHVELFRDFKAMNSVVALCHGPVVSVFDMGESPYESNLKNQAVKKWVHYMLPSADKIFGADDYNFGRQEHEIQELFFMSINQQASLTMMIVPQGRQTVRKLVYSPSLGTLKPIHSNFKLLGSLKIVRVQSNLSFAKIREVGDAPSCQYLEVRSDNQDKAKPSIMSALLKGKEIDKVSIFRTTPTGQVIQLGRDIDPKLNLIKVQGAPSNLMFLTHVEQRNLLIYKIPVNASIALGKAMDMWLAQRITDFVHKEGQTYFHVGDTLNFIQDGNFKSLNLHTGKTFTFDCGGYLTQMLMTEEQRFIARDKRESLYANSLAWVRTVSENGKPLPYVSMMKDPVAMSLIKPIFKMSTAVLTHKLESDPFMLATLTFLTPQTLVVFQSPYSPVATLDGSAFFSQRFVAYNVSQDGESQSEFNQSLSALNAEDGFIKTWNQGTGKVTGITILDSSFKGFKLHTIWEGHCLLVKEEQESGVFSAQKIASWMKVLVQSSQVPIVCNFKHQAKLGASVYVSSDNQLLLEFFQEAVIVYQLKRMERELLLASVKMTTIRLEFNRVSSPQYFSPDFTQYLDYNLSGKFFKFYSLPTSSDSKKQIIKKEYQRIEPQNIPPLDSVHLLENNMYLIEFAGNLSIRYVNKFKVEQTLPINIDLDGRANLIHEINLSIVKLDIKFFSRHYDQASQTKSLQKLDLKDILQLKTSQYHYERLRYYQQGCRLFDQSQNVSIPGPLRVLTSFTFDHWRMLEIISNEQIHLGTLAINIQVEGMQILYDCVCPTGDNIFHYVMKLSSDKLNQMLLFTRLKKLVVRMVPNLKGITPLHLCIRDSQYQNTINLLKILGEAPLDDHAKFIQDIMPDLLKLCPLALGDYLDARLVKVDWTPVFSEGKLRHQEGTDFAVVPLGLFPLSEAAMKREIFDDSHKNADLKMPIRVTISDIPEMHMLSNETGKQFLKQLSQVKNSGNLYSKKYIQALIEVKWPPIRQELMRKIFMPYAIYLALFNLYALYFVYERNDTFLNTLSFIVQIILLVLTGYSMINELKEFRAEPELYVKHLWNYLDLIPKLLVVLSIIIDMSSGIFVTEDTQSSFQAKLNSVSIFCLWINLLNFLRLFRNTGYLIQLIIQVIKDMKFFVRIVCVTLISFSCAFYILSRSNHNEGDFLGGSFVNANAFIYLLVLGGFDTTVFGEENLLLTWGFFVVATFFLIIVMLNLLISIISDTFSKVQSQAKQRMYSEFAQLIIENYHLLSDSTINELDSRGKYLYLAWLEESVETDEAQEFKDSIIQQLDLNKWAIITTLKEKLDAQDRENQKHYETEFRALASRVEELQAQVRALAAKP